MNAATESGLQPGPDHPAQPVACWRQARSLKAEIALAFGAVIALMFALGLIFHFSDQRSAAALDQLLKIDGRMADLSLRSELSMAKALDAESDFVLSVDHIGVARGRELHLLPMVSHLRDLREYLTSVRILSSDSALRDQVDRIELQVQQYEDEVLALADMYGKTGASGAAGAAGAVEERMDEAALAIESALEDLHTAANKRALGTRSSVERAALFARWTVFGMIAVAILVGVIAALIVWRRINGSVSGLIAFSGRVATGDFSVRAPEGREHEFAILAHAMNRMAQSLEASQTQLVATARRAGMAEIATNVLHNVGNILNSVNVSAGVMGNMLRASRVQGLSRAVQMMDEHAADLGGFLTGDDKGKLLPGYLSGTAQALLGEQQGLLEELERLSRSIDHIKSVVATQQSYATGSTSSGVIEPVQICELAEDALRMNGDALARQGIAVVRQFATIPPVRLDRARVLQILVNLVSNAKHAMESEPSGSRRITLRIETAAESRLRVSVQDEGEGIPAENLTRIFAHGFTTRKAGHGFGLHSCALAARQMGGTLTVHSDGPGQGAIFTLELPIDGTRASHREPIHTQETGSRT